VTLGPELDMRRGLLGKGGVLMSTSRADRTSPVLRGKWILENLMGTARRPAANVPPSIRSWARRARSVNAWRRIARPLRELSSID
jgi:hypothetical protein